MFGESAVRPKWVTVICRTEVTLQLWATTTWTVCLKICFTTGYPPLNCIIFGESAVRCVERRSSYNYYFHLYKQYFKDLLYSWNQELHDVRWSDKSPVRSYSTAWYVGGWVVSHSHSTAWYVGGWVVSHSHSTAWYVGGWVVSHSQGLGRIICSIICKTRRVMICWHLNTTPTHTWYLCIYTYMWRMYDTYAFIHTCDLS